MRLSIHPHDPDWHPVASWVSAVYLDGAKTTYVIRFDDAAGHLDRYVTDADGNPQMNPAKTDLLTERLSGAITVSWRDMPEALWDDWRAKNPPTSAEKSAFAPNNRTPKPLALPP